MATRARHGSYLYQRPESRMWWLRLRSPSKTVSKSLGTPDKAQAELLALPEIAHHKAALLAARPHFETAWRCERKPGLHVNPDGGHIAATERELQFFDASGAHVRTEPNGGFGLWPVNHKGNTDTLNNSRIGMLMLSLSGETPDRPSVPVKDGDDALLETYITHMGLTGLREKQARDIWHTFKTTVGKPIAKCTRDDGRAIVAALGDVKSATLHRRMVPLVATVNLAIKEGKLTFNPFAGCTPVRDDETERDPFSDDDMKLIRANLHLLDPNDQLLVRILATTGMDRGEAFSIDREEKENGIRFCVVGTKTAARPRRVPFPKDLLPFLPKVIKGPLIVGRKDSAGKRLKKWQIEIGITDPDKAPMHSFRHRAAKRLRAAYIPEDVRESIGGWANGRKKVSRKYGNKHGAGYPISVLRKAIDKIGF